MPGTEDHNSVIESAPTNTASGNVLSNDTSPGGFAVRVSAVAGSPSNLSWLLVGTYGSIIINADGTYTYTLNNQAVTTNALNASQVASDQFTYTVTDDHGWSSNATISISVSGTNDAPLAIAEVATAREGATAAASGNLLSNDTDSDSGSTLQLSIVSGMPIAGPTSVVGRFGSLTVSANGSYSYSLNQTDPDTVALRAGEVGEEIFEYQVSDGQGGTSISSLTVSVHGIDPPGASAVGPEIALSGPTGFGVAGTTLSSGNVLLLWVGAGSTGGSVVFGSRASPDGTSQTTPVELVTNHIQYSAPQVCALEGGGFIVLYTPSLSTVVGQFFSAAGVKIGEAIPIAQDVQHNAMIGDDFNVSATHGGGFAVSWNSGGNIKAQVFDSNGSGLSTPVLVNGVVDGTQIQSSITTLSTGKLLVTWTDYSGANGDSDGGIKAQLLFPNGAKSGGEFLINTETLGSQADPVVAALPTGGFVSAWCTNNATIAAQVFDANGLKVGGQIAVNTGVLGRGTNPTVTILADGQFVVGWSNYQEGVPDGRDALARVFNGSSASVGGIISFGAESGNQSAPDIMALQNGNFVVTWNTDGSSRMQVFSSVNDYLRGTPGADTLQGGIGDDQYEVNHAADSVVELAGEGADRIYSSINFTLVSATRVETLSTTANGGTEAINLSGNEHANSIYGNAGSNVLDGGGGSDVLIGLEGHDQYYVDSAGDVAIESAGGGYDLVLALVDYALAAGSAIDVLSTTNASSFSAINLTGNDLTQDIIGNDGDNALNGGDGGDDWMYGRLGNDTFVVNSANDLAFENAGQGYDTVLTSATYVLQAGASIERLATADATGTTAINLTGNEFSQDIVGNSGSNVLGAVGGDDWLYGGAGNDIYLVDSANDVVFEAAGGGSDGVYVNVSYVLHGLADIEVLSADFLGGTAAISLAGNQLAQEVWGNMGNNLLDGKGGSDVLFSIGGTDIFAFSTALGADNIDRIYGFGTDDLFHLSDDIFAAIAPGALGASAFTTGTEATTASHRIIYNSTTGALLYDADGSSAGAAVHFASIDPGTALSAVHFEVV